MIIIGVVQSSNPNIGYLPFWRPGTSYVAHARSLPAKPTGALQPLAQYGGG
jgi:hypothetical protein